MKLQKYKRLIAYAWRQWPTLLSILAMTVVGAALAAIQPWPLKLLVDYALKEGAAPRFQTTLNKLHLGTSHVTLVFVAAAASVLIFFLNSALDFGLSWAWTSAGQRMVYDLAGDLFHRLQRLSLLFHIRQPVGDSLSRINDDSWCVYTVAESVLISPAQQTMTLITIGAVAYALDPVLATLSLVVAPVLATSAVLSGKRLKQRARNDREAQSRLVSFVHQTLSAIPIVQAFGMGDRNRQTFRRLAAEGIATTQASTLGKNTYAMWNGLITTMGTALILFVGAQRVLMGALSVGSLLVFLGYLRSLEGASQNLLKLWGGLKSVEASIDRVTEILDSEEGVKEDPAAQPLPTITGVRGHIVFENVTFGYEPNRPILKDVSLEALPGQTIALVGPTGAGKSTLVSLIPRFFDPWSGRVTLEGQDLKKLTLSSLRNAVALVLQEPFLLPLSVAENIAYGRPGASQADITQAARDANAEEFILQLPDQYQTILGERGASLSGGQKQRLSIARAILKNASVLILDEPTSALDARTESLLMEALERLMTGRTTFIIAHRLSTTRRADRIVVVDQGQVADVGTHQELLQREGLYRRLHELQISEGKGVLT